MLQITVYWKAEQDPMKDNPSSYRINQEEVIKTSYHLYPPGDFERHPTKTADGWVDVFYKKSY